MESSKVGMLVKKEVPTALTIARAYSLPGSVHPAAVHEFRNEPNLHLYIIRPLTPALKTQY